MTLTTTAPAPQTSALIDNIMLLDSEVAVELFLSQHVTRENAYCPPYIGLELQFVTGCDQEPEYEEHYAVMVNRFPTRVEKTQRNRIANWTFTQNFEGIFTEWRTIEPLSTIRYENSKTSEVFAEEF